MAADMTSRTVPGPAKDWLSEAEVLSLLGDISSRTLDTYIQTGRFPVGVPFGRERKWVWEDVAWYYLGKRIESRLKGKPDDDDAKT